MSKKVILATTNQGKLKEFKALLAPLNFELITINELDEELVPHVLEDGDTFEENALKKARAFYERFGLPCLADDSGLEVDVLHGEPGIYSARYAGEGSTDAENNQKLLLNLQGVPDEQRSAHFTCVIAFVDGAQEILAKGECEGLIAWEPEGMDGFGYDPIFYVPQFHGTMAQLGKEVKNSISHRFHALQDLVQKLKTHTID